MAIENRALFALSIAFTASIVAYPDLPADIPPRAGHHGAFIGAPFVAFLLPAAAIAVWWIVSTLGRHARGAASRSMNPGAAAALFLAAFHVVMLLGFIGGHLWLGRILGIVVGGFLIVTGNELPRARPKLPLGLPTRDAQLSEDSWRRVHRLGGYVRVAMGLAVCAAALWGARGLAQVIVLAVCVELAVSVGAARLLSRRRRAAAGLVLVCWSGVAARAEAQGIPRARIESLPAFIDEHVPQLLEQGRTPGATVAIVHDGRIVVLRGYGQSRLDTRTQVDPSRTLFRIGSVSKVFTSVAALQLANRGALDLQRDVRSYVPGVPLAYGATTHQLLTHTAGLEERAVDASRDPSARLRPLADRLQLSPPRQVIRPGTAYSYSNSNFELAGLVVERVSGLAYEQYMVDRIFAPLRMTSTTAGPPTEANVAENLAWGYRWIGGSQEAVTSRFSSASPSGSITTTAADMARFMLALVGDGSVDEGRILPEDAVRTLFAPQYTPDPRIRARGYAFLEWSTRGRRLYHHDGTLGDHIGVLMVSPGDRFGMFVASNGAPPEGASIGNLLLEPMLTFLAGPAASPPPPPAPPSDAALRARRVAGTYRDYRHTGNDMARLMTLMPMIQTRLTVEADGAIRWRGHRWVEVAPLVFRSTDPPDYSADNPDHIVFRENGRGEIVELHAWGAAYERIGWTEQAPFHLALFASCAVAFLGYGTVRGLRELRRRTAIEDGCAARRCALFVSIMNVGFVVGLPIFFNSLRTSTPLSPPVLAFWLALPLASVAVTALLPGFAVMAWRERWWTRGERFRFSTLAALSVAFMAFLNYWKLLTMPF